MFIQIFNFKIDLIVQKFRKEFNLTPAQLFFKIDLIVQKYSSFVITVPFLSIFKIDLIVQKFVNSHVYVYSNIQL